MLLIWVTKTLIRLCKCAADLNFRLAHMFEDTFPDVAVHLRFSLLHRADLDPIYYCELLKTCPINDNGDCKITSFTVSPTSGPQGKTEYIRKRTIGLLCPAPSEDSDKTAHLRSLIRIFTRRNFYNQGCNIASCGQRRL